MRARVQTIETETVETIETETVETETVKPVVTVETVNDNNGNVLKPNQLTININIHF
jgi:hypothetical protein